MGDDSAPGGMRAARGCGTGPCAGLGGAEPPRSPLPSPAGARAASPLLPCFWGAGCAPGRVPSPGRCWGHLPGSTAGTPLPPTMAALEPALTHQHFTLEPPWSLWHPLGAPQLHPLLAMGGLATTWCTWHPPNLSFTSTVNAARAWTGGTTGCGSASAQGSTGAKRRVPGSHRGWPGSPGSLVLPWLCSTARHRGPMEQGPPESASGTSASGWCWI